jgi:hypothetical protein
MAKTPLLSASAPVAMMLAVGQLDAVLLFVIGAFHGSFVPYLRI